ENRKSPSFDAPRSPSHDISTQHQCFMAGSTFHTGNSLIRRRRRISTKVPNQRASYRESGGKGTQRNPKSFFFLLLRFDPQNQLIYLVGVRRPEPPRLEAHSHHDNLNSRDLQPPQPSRHHHWLTKNLKKRKMSTPTS
ncbi:hypothetical protein U1Q18_007779, partial [Sarracenia purpurea var. burkii]